MGEGSGFDARSLLESAIKPWFSALRLMAEGGKVPGGNSLRIVPFLPFVPMVYKTLDCIFSPTQIVGLSIAG